MWKHLNVTLCSLRPHLFSLGWKLVINRCWKSLFLHYFPGFQVGGKCSWFIGSFRHFNIEFQRSRVIKNREDLGLTNTLFLHVRATIGWKDSSPSTNTFRAHPISHLSGTHFHFVKWWKFAHFALWSRALHFPSFVLTDQEFHKQFSSSVPLKHPLRTAGRERG